MILGVFPGFEGLFPGFRGLLPGFGVWQGRESIGIGFEIHVDGFSAREMEYGSISNDFINFACFRPRQMVS